MNISLVLFLVIILTITSTTQSYIDWSQLEYKPNTTFSELIKPQLNYNVNGRITNGTFVNDPSKFPYQVLIRPTGTTGSYCGGSLISNEWILTAAHCLTLNYKQWTIILGTVDNQDTSTQFVIEKSNYIRHKSYRFPLHDIALMKLSRPVTFTNNIKAIGLDKDASVTKWDNKDALVSGWGRISTKGPESRYLQYAEVKIMSNRECKYKWRGTIKSTHICHKIIENKGICFGDSGGPLTAIENGIRILIGIVSFGDGNRNGCESKIPDGYTRVSSYRKWICENTNGAVC